MLRKLKILLNLYPPHKDGEKGLNPASLLLGKHLALWIAELIPEIMALVEAYREYKAMKNEPFNGRITRQERAEAVAQYERVFVKAAIKLAEKLGSDPYTEVTK